jgi:hypothetical protein
MCAAAWAMSRRRRRHGRQTRVIAGPLLLHGRESCVTRRPPLPISTKPGWSAHNSILTFYHPIQTPHAEHQSRPSRAPNPRLPDSVRPVST